VTRRALRSFVASVTAKAQVVEQADTLGLNPSDFGRTGSSPVLGTVRERRCEGGDLLGLCGVDLVDTNIDQQLPRRRHRRNQREERHHH
jgi:hypothetical protein